MILNRLTCRASALLAAIVFAGQLSLLGGTDLVCRYTGKVLERCCCPKVERAKAFESDHSRLIAPCCCDSRERPSLDDPTLSASRGDRSSVDPPLATPAGTGDAMVVFRPLLAGELLSGHDPPPRLEIYLFVGRLLI